MAAQSPGAKLLAGSISWEDSPRYFLVKDFNRSGDNPPGYIGIIDVYRELLYSLSPNYDDLHLAAERAAQALGRVRQELYKTLTPHAWASNEPFPREDALRRDPEFARLEAEHKQLEEPYLSARRDAEFELIRGLTDTDRRNRLVAFFRPGGGLPAQVAVSDWQRPLNPDRYPGFITNKLQPCFFENPTKTALDDCPLFLHEQSFDNWLERVPSGSRTRAVFEEAESGIGFYEKGPANPLDGADRRYADGIAMFEEAVSDVDHREQSDLPAEHSKPVVTKSEAEAAYCKRVEGLVREGRHSTEKDDRAFMSKLVSNFTRAKSRALRKRLAPPEWGKSGPKNRNPNRAEK